MTQSIVINIKKYQYQINNNNNFHGVQYFVDCGRSCCYAVMLGESNHILFATNVNAQLADAEETREDLRAVIEEEKLQKVVPCIGM